MKRYTAEVHEAYRKEQDEQATKEQEARNKWKTDPGLLGGQNLPSSRWYGLSLTKHAGAQGPAL